MRTIPSSELIINGDGSIFHLHLKPEQLADIVILVGDPARVSMIAEYFEEKSSSERVMEIVRASSSLPFVSPITYVDGIPMLDGGIVDSIPVEHAMSQGYDKQVVVLTRNKGYRKKESKMPLAKVTYKKYPNLRKALQERNATYNRTMDLIERLEAEGKITVIRPLKPVEVGRMEKDTAKLRALYQEGYDLAEQLLTE